MGAEKGGVQVWDMLSAVNGKEVSRERSRKELQAALAAQARPVSCVVSQVFLKKSEYVAAMTTLLKTNEKDATKTNKILGELRQASSAASAGKTQVKQDDQKPYPHKIELISPNWEKSCAGIYRMDTAAGFTRDGRPTWRRHVPPHYLLFSDEGQWVVALGDQEHIVSVDEHHGASPDRLRSGWNVWDGVGWTTDKDI